MSRRLSASQAQRLSLAHPAVSGYPFTLAAWVRPGELAANASYRVLTLSENINGGSAFHSLCINALGSTTTHNHACVDTYLQSDGGFTYAKSTATVRLHAWNHLAGVWPNPDQRRVLLHAGHQGLDTQPRSFGPMQRTTVGAIERGPILNSPFEGLIAHAAVWRAALDPHELHRLARGESPLKVRPWALAAYWPLAKDDLDGRPASHPGLLSVNAPGWSLRPPMLRRRRDRGLIFIPRLTPPAEQSIAAACHIDLVGVASLRVTPAGQRLKHVDFETGDLSEFTTPPLINEGATMQVTSASAFPDRPGRSGLAHSLRVTFATEATAASVGHTLPRSEANCHVRTLLGHASVQSGGAVLAEATDDQGVTVWALRLDDSNTLSLQDDTGQSRITHLLDALPWHCTEVALHDGNSLALRVDGVLWGEATLPTPRAVQRVRWGLIAKDPLTQGDASFDELVISTAPVGLVHPTPRTPHASDPTRWLVLRRAGDEASTAWALAYIQRRGLPYANLLAVECPPDEVASPSTVLSLRAAITGHLAQHFQDHPPTGLLLGHRLPGYAQTDSGPKPLANLLCTDTSSASANPYFSPQDTGERPLASALGSLRIAARIDRESLDEALGMLDRADAASNRSLGFSDVFALQADNEPTLTAWSSSVSAQRCLLRITRITHLNEPGDTLEHDAITWSLATTPPSWTGPSAARALLIAINDATPTLGSARDPLSAGVGLAGLHAGYAAVIGASAAVPAEHRPHPHPLMDALRRGWTLGEAWLLAQPRLDGTAYLLGDPLITLRFPSPGWEWFEHTPHNTGSASTLARAALPITQLALDLPPTMSPQAAPSRWLLRRIAPHAPPITQALAATWEAGHDGPVALLPSPVWPLQNGWVVRCDADVAAPAIVFDRSPRSLNIRALRLEAQSPQGVVTLAHEAAPAPHRRFIEHRLPRTPGTRYRWVLRAESGHDREGPWSLPTPPLDVATLSIHILE